jgi:alkylated DNA repair dioxygenase AlkB
MSPVRSAAARGQPSLFDDAPALPEGLAYVDDLITPAEEQALVARFSDLPFKPYEFRGFLGNRRTVSFGWRYDHNRMQLDPAHEIPPFLLELRARAAAFAGMPPDALHQAMVTEYAPGAGIGWHRDRPEFGEVLGVSFLTPCVFRLRRRQGAGWERASFTAEPRSAYVLRGPARSEWQHSIAPMDRLRYSVTFRNLRAGF